MSLHLIAMFIHAPKEVGPPVHVKHDAFRLCPRLFSFGMVPPHLDPFCLQRSIVSPPLPPMLSTYSINAMPAQLRSNSVCRFTQTLFGYLDLFDAHPARAGDPLRREGLDVLDSMMGGILEELADEFDAFVV